MPTESRAAEAASEEPDTLRVPWSVSQHDTIPAVEMWLNHLETHVYLSAFLSSEGLPFVPPYDDVRDRIKEQIDLIAERKRKGQPPSNDVADTRLRTWRSTFEDFGLISIDENSSKITLTRLGRTIRDLFADLQARIEGANEHLAKHGVEMLNRYTLFNPVDAGDAPRDSDIRPFNLIWRAMRHLSNKLHWEELNRVLMHVQYEHQVPTAFAHIRSVRDSCGGVYGADDFSRLGDPAVSDGGETKRRITPWFTRAGFGGLLISSKDDHAGFRHLETKFVPLIDEAIATPVVVPSDVLADKSKYLLYITESVARTPAKLTSEDSDSICKILDAVTKYGNRKIICLSGLPATGKTRLAKIVAERLADGDPYRHEEIQFHENTSYNDFMEGFVPQPSGAGFELRPKVFKIINQRALTDPAQRIFVLLIEELTRANVHAILGELLTYIEHRERKFRLIVSQEQAQVASNLVVLATMNPRDRSALTLDDAIRRRLHCIAIGPSPAALRQMLEGVLPDEALHRLVKWFEQYCSLLPFGHGVFSGILSESDLRDVWDSNIMHFFTDLSGSIRKQYESVVRDFPWA
jgi:hypothetical protein